LPGRRLFGKWEHLAIGPRLDDRYQLMLTGMETDYSVTQDAGSVRRDVHSNSLPADSVSRIR
jgi:hypothetical protein